MKRLSLPKTAKYIWQKPKWPDFTWDIKELAPSLGKTRFAQGCLLGKMKELGLEESQKAFGEILTQEAIKTSAVEGKILPPDSVRSSVAKYLGLPSAGLPMPDRYTDGIVEVLLDATIHYQKTLTAKRIQGWQAALFPTGFSSLHPIRVGRWRGEDPMRVVSGPIGKEKIHFEAPPRKTLEKEMKRFFSWWVASRKTEDGLIRAGLAHFYFVTLHPFEDGNGRIARALTDMALAQDEKIEKRFYSLSSQIMVERKNYYDQLEASQKGELDITAWLLWFLQCMQRAIFNSEKLVSNILAKAAFWREHANVEMNARQRKILNRLLDAGAGNFVGGLTTRKYVSLAKVSRVTAYREITDLLNKGLLKQRKGQGRSVSYDVAVIHT